MNIVSMLNQINSNEIVLPAIQREFVWGEEKIAKLARMKRRETLEREFPGQYVIFGHIGDAHLHANILPASGEQFECAKQVMIDLARRAVALGGTVSAEHGLGKRKAHLLALQYTPAEIEEMKRVKRRLDPAWLLGRGTLFGEA